MNILTFDIEEWYLEKNHFGNHPERYKEYDKYLDRILEVLDRRGFKGTFFCVGGMATDFPEVLKKIESQGHEIGCHSFKHMWLNKMSRDELMEDTRMAIDALEQCIGKKVISYRAPAFSIGQDNKWAFEVLSQCGIKCDASVFPAERDFGGFAQFTQKTPSMLNFEGGMIKEFPVCTTKLWGKEMAYSGGGYFRFFPLRYIKKEMGSNDYSMLYFHIRDLLPESEGMMSRDKYESYFKEPGSLKNRYVRYVKTNLGKKQAFEKLVKLIEKEDFLNLEQADKIIDWESKSTVIL